MWYDLRSTIYSKKYPFIIRSKFEEKISPRPHEKKKKKKIQKSDKSEFQTS